jgi:lipopolysaccharide export system permease protein
MKLVEKYIAKSVLSAIGLVTLMLIGLQIFILFVNEMDTMGHNDFGFWQALIYVLLQMPYQVSLFFPMSSLLGCLIGLSVLANNSELIVMRASGFSIEEVILAVFKASLIVIVIVTLVTETIVPKLVSIANDKKALALSGGQAIRTNSGVWFRSKNDFVSIGEVFNKYSIKNVFQYQFNQDHQLRLARHIAKAQYFDKKWHAYDVKQTDIGENHTKASSIKSMIWAVEINPILLNVAANESDEMNVWQLYRFIKAQKNSHQNVVPYEIVFWQRVIAPLSTCVMMFIAIPFIFGPLRTATMGARLLAGAGAGFGFHMLNKFFAPISALFQLPPIIGATGPTLLFAILAYFMMKKVR